MELYPYQIGSCWVFDDSRAGLKEEAFVLGMSEIISRVVEHHKIPDASKGFRMIFSHAPFEGYHAEIGKIAALGRRSAGKAKSRSLLLRCPMRRARAVPSIRIPPVKRGSFLSWSQSFFVGSGSRSRWGSCGLSGPGLHVAKNSGDLGLHPLRFAGELDV